jgi:hypothetical protein
MKTTKLDKTLAYLQEKHNAEWCTSYGEPGYSDPENGIIFANWNDVPKGLQEWLEKCGYALEWSDEWHVDYSYSKAYRTSADSYSWEPSIMLPAESCEYITPDDSPDTWIEACQLTANNQPISCLPSWINSDDILNSGFELKETDFENGFFEGQNDSPESIAKKYFADGAYRVVFQKSENSQFYCRFRVWVDMTGENKL